MADRPATAASGPAGLIRPMLATAGPVPAGAGWAFEIKFDGVRAIGYAGPSGLRTVSRNDRDISRSYPEVAELRLPAGLVVDGELVALDEHGRPDFALLQQRMQVTAPTPAQVASVPVRFVVFDLLHDGRDVLLDLPYEQRRAQLLDLDLGRIGVVVPQNFTDTPGALVMTAAREQGLEGVVAKRLASVYQPGRRSRAWVKTPVRHAAEVVIAGWSPSTGNQNVLGSLLLAGYDDTDELVYLGDVGTGFTDAARRHLLQLLRPLQRPDPPFPAEFARARGWPGRAPNRGPVHWVAPVLVGEIEYRAFTRDNNFRHPSWRGLRPDKDAADTRIPPPQERPRTP